MTSTRDGEVIQVSAAVDVEQAHKWARLLEEDEARRSWLPVNKARVPLARRLGLSPGTLENLRRLRTKVVPNWMMTRLRAEFVAVLQNEIMRLEHEIHLAKQTGVGHRDNDLAAAEAQVVKARKILNGAE